MIEIQMAGIGVLAIAGVAILIAAALAYWRTIGVGDPIHLSMLVGGFCLLAFALLGLLLVTSSVLGFLLWLAALVVWGIAIGRSRVAQRQALLDLIALSVEKRMPLLANLSVFAEDERGAFGQQVQELAEKLRQGLPLESAVRQTRGVLPNNATMAIEIGEQTGDLAMALRDTKAIHQMQHPLWQAMTGRLFYLFLFLSVAPTVSAFLVWEVVPKLQRVFGDFGLELPWLTQRLIAGSDSPLLSNVIGLLVPAGWLLLVYVTLHYLGWIHAGFPVLNRYLIRFETGTILQSLAVAAERGYPLDKALSTLSQTHPKRAIRNRLARVVADMAAGRDWCESLLDRKLVTSADAAVLQAAQRAGNLPWALREMALGSQRRVVYRLEILIQVISPLAVLALGVLVMIFVVGYFWPLVTLIERLT